MPLPLPQDETAHAGSGRSPAPRPGPRRERASSPGWTPPRRDAPSRGSVPARSRNAPWRRWAGRAAWTAAAAVTSCLVAIAVLLAATPPVGDAQAVARTDALAHHSPYPGPPVPARFAAALTSTEDHRFGSVLEPGFDPFAVARVVFARLTGGGDQGGATLYQQLAKLLYDPHSAGLKLYAYEVALGIKLKFSYTGEQIMRMYADVAYFGHGYYGIEVASCGYFGRPPGLLSWPQAALLAGLVQAPTDYDPLRHPALARSREGHVLSRLVATGVLTRREATAAFAVPVRSLVAGAGGCPS